MTQDPYCLEWVGRTAHHRQQLVRSQAEALAATLDRATSPASAEALPPGWQWLYFNPVIRRSSLGDDGHPLRTPDSFLPPVALARRMWAGSRIQYLAPLALDAYAERNSRIVRISPKEGRSGRMCFVTVEHRYSCDGSECIVEEQDIVYRDAASIVPSTSSASASISASSRSAASATVPAMPPHGIWQRTVLPDRVLLFRYSALTFNGHRIHYDRQYAREVECYCDLVVHGPLTATLLQGFAQDCLPGKRLVHFAFKGLQPLFVDRKITLYAEMGPTGTLELRALSEDGHAAMEATAVFNDVS